MPEMSLKHLQAIKDDLPFSRPPTPGHTPHKLGFYGLGAMGGYMARNLAKSMEGHPAGGLPVIVYNRTVSKAETLLEKLGPNLIKIAESLEELVLESDIIFTNLANDEVVKSVYTQFHKVLKESPPAKIKIFVETSTIYPVLAGELDTLLSEVPHARLVACPVFGLPAAADKAELICVMSGDYRSKKEVAYLLVPSVGRKVYDLGGNIEKASTFKLVGNSLTLGAMEVLAESFTLAEKSGIGHELAFDLLKDLFPASSLISYAEKMLSGHFDGTEGFSIDDGIKDASHIRRLTGEHNSPMPVIDTAHQHMLTARALHISQARLGKAQYNVLDTSALIAGSRTAAGLGGLDSGKHSKVVELEEE